MAVSKFHPVSRLMEAYDAGQRLFGENRPQELAQKVPQMPSDVQWHFIGHLQTNKLKLVLPYVSMVQSVDSFHLLEAIDKWGRDNGKVIDILLELHLGAEETKHGFSEEEILSIVEAGKGIPSQTASTSFRPLPPQAAGPSLLPMNIQGGFLLGLTGLISLHSTGLSRVFSSTTIPRHQFFSAQISLWSDSHIHT